MSRAPGSVLLLATANRVPARSIGVRVEVLAGRAPGTATVTGPAILIPWAFGPDCRPIPWGSAHPWSPPDEPAVYSARPRPRDEWVDGLPTFDIYMAVREPLWRSRDNRGYMPATGESLLTPAEFLEFYAILPTDQELAERQPVALARLDAWESAHPLLAAREPARSLLGHVRRYRPPPSAPGS
jgi:hypothetical protein